MFCVEQRKPCVSKVPRRAILSFRGSLRSRTISVSGAVSTLRQKREDINNEGKKKNEKSHVYRVPISKKDCTKLS